MSNQRVEGGGSIPEVVRRHGGESLSGLKRIEPNGVMPVDQYIQDLRQYVIGQEEALQLVARELVLLQAHMADPERPRTTFLFAGQTGVGKTELSEAIARVLYGDDWMKRYKRVDCNELSNSGAVTSLTGSSPTWVGYGDDPLFTPAFLGQEGGTVITFDEIEKAHPKIWHALLTILDKGSLSAWIPRARKDSPNESAVHAELDFRTSIIVFTTNAGAEELQRARTGGTMGFRTSEERTDTRVIGLDGLRSAFGGTPEFLGRIGDQRTVVFNELKHADYCEIFDVMMRRINDRITGLICVSDELKKDIIRDVVGDGRYGARDLKGAIERRIVSEVANLRAAGQLQHDTQVFLDFEGGVQTYYEGDVVSPQVMTSEKQPEERGSVSEAIQLPIDVQLDVPFKIGVRSYAMQSVDTCTIPLHVDGKKLGEIHIHQAVASERRARVHYHGGARLCRLEVSLDKVMKAQPVSILLTLDDKTYRAQSIFGKASGGYARLTTQLWERRGRGRSSDEAKDDDAPFELILNPRELSRLTVTIASHQGSS